MFKSLFYWAYFSGELIFGGAYYWSEFCVSKSVGPDNKNSLKHQENSLKQLKTASTNIQWAYIWEGVLLEGYLRLRFGGFIYWKAYFWGLIIGILRNVSADVNDGNGLTPEQLAIFSSAETLS